jgi:hypothetical protein
MKPKRNAVRYFIWLFLSLALSVNARIFYVAPDGSDQAAGTLAAPFATIAKAQNTASAGDTFYFRNGTYEFNSTTAAIGIDLTKSGMSGKRINYWAYPGEIPVFDFTKMTAAERIKGVNVSGGWLHLKGLEMMGVPQNLRTVHESWCIYVNGGSNTIFELLNLHDNMGPGLFIVKGGNNLVLNCDSHDNYDLYSSSNGTDPNAPGENADGFGCHVTTAGNTGNVFRGCRAWYNSDDGFDCINCKEAVLIENCWIWLNGYIPGTMTAAGNGNGFKMGGFGLPPTGYPTSVPQHTVRNCVAFLNRAAGFYQNHHLVPNYYYNNTSYNNRSANFNMLGYNLTTSADAGMGIYRNNIAFTGTAVSNASGADAANNSWNMTSVSVTSADFLSIDTVGVSGPRKPDGSLPDVRFLHLATGSDLIDKGVNVSLPYSGNAPDLGAFESGATAIKLPGNRFVIGHPDEAISAIVPVIRVFDLKGRSVPEGLTGASAGPFVFLERNSDVGLSTRLTVRVR